MLALRAANIAGNIHNRMCQDSKTPISRNATFSQQNCFNFLLNESQYPVQNDDDDDVALS